MGAVKTMEFNPNAKAALENVHDKFTSALQEHISRGCDCPNCVANTKFGEFVVHPMLHKASDALENSDAEALTVGLGFVFQAAFAILAATLTRESFRAFMDDLSEDSNSGIDIGIDSLKKAAR